jgi:hypothetical protein
LSVFFIHRKKTKGPKLKKIAASFFRVKLFYAEDGGYKFILNAGTYLSYQRTILLNVSREPQIAYFDVV